MRSNGPTPFAQVGLSLIELLIAMAIGLVLVVTIGYAYIGAKQSFRTQDAASRLQENARYAFEYMAKDIRMAGFTGGVRADGTNTTNYITGFATWDSSSNLLNLFVRPLSGSNDAAPAGVTACPTTPTAANAGCYLRGDSITVVHADNETVFRLTAQADPTLTLTAAPSLNAGDVLVLADYTRAAAFQASAVAGSTVTYNTTGVTPGNSAAALGTFNGTINARYLYKMSGVTYYIGSNPSLEPALYRRRLSRSGTTAQPVVEEVLEGIRDMQIEYGADTDATADNTVNSYVTANVVTNNTGNVFNAALSSADLRWQRILSVRITLNQISRQNMRVASSSDGLLRKTMTSTIAVRNRLP